MMLDAALKALDMLGLDEADNSFAPYYLGRKSTRRSLLILCVTARSRRACVSAMVAKGDAVWWEAT